MQKVRATLFGILLSAIMRIDMCAGPCRGEVAAWDVYMDAMSSIGAIVPWMLTEGVCFLLSCYLSFITLPCFLCSSMVSHCLTCNDIHRWLPVQNHERDSPFTGDRYNNTEADSGGQFKPCHLFACTSLTGPGMSTATM